uniref:Putative phosphoenolpyruvate synthase n=1 Tax=Melanaphis sacchari TaxID=742174 RepID=A0A2H8TRJ0_9HEMI
MENFRQRLCFSTPTISDILLDHERNNDVQDLMVFFGADKMGNMILLCVNQNVKLKQSKSLIHIRDPTGLEFTNQETDKGSYEFSSWKTLSLQFQCTVPMQTWRIIFSGRLKNGENYRHVKINFLWKPFGFPVYCDRNNTFFKHEIDHSDSEYVNNLLGFDQFGQISGLIVVDGKSEMINMHAMKLRRWNMSIDDSMFAGFMNTDIMCSIQKLKRINCRGHLKTTSVHEILTSDEIHFKNVENESPTIKIHHKNLSLNANLKSQINVNLNTVLIKTVIEDNFKGILLCFKDAFNTDNTVKCAEDISVNDHEVGLTLNLKSEMCAFSNIVGNKAKSLFRLKKAIVNGLINDAMVPDGICITTIAMRTHINENKELSNYLNNAIEKAKLNDYEQLSNYCERLNEQWKSTKLCAELLEAISDSVSEHRVYAVRSSGTFEDGKLTSSAGQYITKLGCAGHTSKVAAAVLECWSSNFSARALTYRKNNGQPLMCDMAVIIQDQVSGSGVAGVAFSRDPNTGDPGKIIIAASYGLEKAGVVSGSDEPFEVIVSRLQFDSVVNDSTTSVELPLTTSNFIVENGDDVKPRCVSDNLVKKLADICIRVENVFGSPQDIEWVAVEDQVYLLQTRPITSIFTWTNDEITREFDSAFTSDDVVMFYNVKEVYPNPMHTLSSTLDFFSTYPLFKLTETEPTDIYCNKQMCHTHNHICLNVCKMFQDLQPGSVYVKIIEYSIAGKSFLTDNIWEKILLKNRKSVLQKILKSYSSFKETLHIESLLNETYKLICNANIKQSDTALDLLNNINSVMDVLEKVTYCHVASSMNNIISHKSLAIIGLHFNKDSDVDTLSNFAMLINTPDIINVSMLKDIQAIAGVISEMPSKKEFCDLPVERCNDWLKLNCEKGYGQLENFIKKYGHKGVQELDFGSETWSTDRNRLFSCLQSLILYRNHRPDKISVEIDSRRFTRGCFNKMIFDYLLKRYRQSISYREQSKDMLVQITHKLRLGYRNLGEKLVAEGKIPDLKLIFFMSQYEVRKMCENNNCPEIVHKAMKRRKLWPDWALLQFDDVCYGPPVPKKNLDEEFVYSSIKLQLKGFCVFPGVIKGRACVLEHIEDARYLRTGDILIVKSVDIAWSPYFPIISGLVTEIGGVISHGAVVAREYGLPCLVGVQNVKKYFKTGDMVILDSEERFIIKDENIMKN